MTQILEKIIEMSLFGSVAIVAVIILRLLFSKVPKKVTVWFWLVAAVRLLCPVNFSSALSIFNFDQAADIKNVAQKAPTVVQDLTVNNRVLDRDYIDYLRKAAKEPTVTTRVMPEVQEQVSAIDINTVLFGIWIVGMAVLALMIIIRSVRISQRLGIKGINGASDIFEVDGIRTSFVIGVLNQKICVPESVSGFEREYILAHERMHIKNKDQLIKSVMLIILCIHWFNPLVWVMYRLLINDIEMRCDEEVIDLYGDKIKTDYCLSMVLHASEGISHIGVLDSTFAKKTIGGLEIKMRIMNLIKYKKISAAAAALCLAVAIGGVWAISSNASNDKSGVVTAEETENTAAETSEAAKESPKELDFDNAYNRKQNYALRMDIHSEAIQSLLKELESAEASMDNVIRSNFDVMVRSYEDNTFYLPHEYDKAKDLTVKVPDALFSEWANKYNDDDHKIVDYCYIRKIRKDNLLPTNTPAVGDTPVVEFPGADPDCVLPGLSFSILEKGNDYIRESVTLSRDHFDSAQEFLDMDSYLDPSYVKVSVKETDFGYQKSFYHIDAGYTDYENYYKDSGVLEKIVYSYWSPIDDIKCDNTTYKADKSISKMNDKLISEGCEDDWITKCGKHTVCSIYNDKSDSDYRHLYLFSNMSFNDLADFDKTFNSIPSAKELKNSKQLQAVSLTSFNTVVYFCSSNPAVKTEDGFKKDYMNDEGKVVASLEYIKSEKILIVRYYNL